MSGTTEKLYYYYARDIEGYMYRGKKNLAYYVLEVEAEKDENGEKARFMSHSVIPRSIVNLLKSSAPYEPFPFGPLRQMTADGKFKEITPRNYGSYYDMPLVYRDKDDPKKKHLYIKAFEGAYNPADPKGLFPPKPQLFRVVTVLGETVKTRHKYVKYTMSNREFQVLDLNFKEYGYYICDYSGNVSFVKKETLVSIINRYGATNAKIEKLRDSENDDGQEHIRVVGLHGDTIPAFEAPEKNGPRDPDVHYWFDDDKKQAEICDSKGEIWDPDIGILRKYVDTFFDLRRSELPIEEDNADSEAAKEALRGFVDEIELYLRVLLTKTADRAGYYRIAKKFSDLKARFDDDEVYRRTKEDLLLRPGSRQFRVTGAFEEMLSETESNPNKSNLDRLVNIQTLSVIPGDVLASYTSILLIEPEITNYLREQGEELKYKLEGTCCRIKSPSSLYSKLYERDGKDDNTTDELFKNTKDILRYTVVFDNIGDYCEKSEKLLNGLMEKFGGKLDKFRNYWTPYVKGDYKGLNTVVTLPERWYDTRDDKSSDKKEGNSRFIVHIPSFSFEVQFHTEKSLEVKMQNHASYEKARGKDVTPEEREKEEFEMQKRAKTVDAPEGAEYLNRYSNEYIIALKNTIMMLENELDTILKNNAELEFIDQRITHQ